jgi:hypothetical protein
VTDIDLEPNATLRRKKRVFHRKKKEPNTLIPIQKEARLEARGRLEGAMDASLNILGEPLDTCSCDPMTGWYRDGNCNTDSSDRGSHTVCCVVTEEFLNFALSKGNDLITPMVSQASNPVTRGVFALELGLMQSMTAWRAPSIWKRRTKKR